MFGDDDRPARTRQPETGREHRFGSFRIELGRRLVQGSGKDQSRMSTEDVYVDTMYVLQSGTSSSGNGTNTAASWTR